MISLTPLKKHREFLLLLLISIVLMYVLSTAGTGKSQLYLKPSALITGTKELHEKQGPNLHNFYQAGSNHKSTDATNHQSLKETCKPKTNIVFIKTHKTGGSTLTNILNRFAVKHNIFLLKRTDLKNQSSQISRQVSKVISSFHHFYERKVLNDLMPNDVIYVTQLRHPLTQLISLLNFKGYSNVGDPTEVYINWASAFKYSEWNYWRQLCIPANVSNEEFKSYVDQLSEQFDLVTITEQFDLSLLLLRRKLCWDITDMLYIPMKKADYKAINTTKMINMTYTDIINKKYEKVNPNAYTLYRHFNKTLSNLIDEAGPDLQEELMWFQDKKQKVSNYCSKYIELIVQNISKFLDVVNTSDVLNIPSSKWGRAKIFDPVECAMLKMQDRTFRKISAVKQMHSNQKINLLKSSKKIRELYNLSRQPVHPKYGIPLPVLTSARAYDLNENIVQHGTLWQKKIDENIVFFLELGQRLDRCAAKNHET